MPVNDFKAFATGENANVLSQAEYEELDAVDAGFQSGIARSEQLNKVWRQASTIAAVVAGFIADKSGNDVVDNGDTKALEASLLKALLNNSTSQLDGRYLQSASNLADVGNTAAARGNLGLGNLAVKNSLTAADVGAYPVNAGELKGEAWTTFVNNYRIIANNKGVFWRFDGSNYYLMLTKDGDPKGGWNDLRPLIVNVQTGELSTDHTFRCAQNIVASGSVYAGGGNSILSTDGNVYGPLWGGWLNNWLSGQLNSRVSSFRLAGWGTATNGNNDNTFANAPDGTVVVGVQQKTNYTAVNYRYPQILVNGNWYNVGVA